MSTLVSTGEPEPKPSGLVAAFLVALLIHAGALVGIAYYRLAPPAPPGENVISIDLAPQMADAETVTPNETLDASPAPTETVPTEKPTEAEPTRPPDTTAQVAPEETVAEKPPEAVEPPPAVALTEPPPEAVPTEPESQVITSAATQAEPLAPPPPVARPEPPKPVKPDLEKLRERREAKLKAAREEKRREQIEEQREKILKERREAKLKAARDARVRAAESAGSSTRSQAATSRQSGSGQAARGNDPNAMAQWKGMIASAIHGRMNRNAAAGTSGGVATVRFTVSRGGQVLSAGLAGSSGVGAIDSAALAAVRGSLPAAPAGITQPSLSVTVPMRFSPGR